MNGDDDDRGGGKIIQDENWEGEANKDEDDKVRINARAGPTSSSLSSSQSAAVAEEGDTTAGLVGIGRGFIIHVRSSSLLSRVQQCSAATTGREWCGQSNVEIEERREEVRQHRAALV